MVAELPPGNADAAGLREWYVWADWELPWHGEGVVSPVL
jgi:hypothetical protein